MSKINKKSINLGLKILAILAFALIFIPLNRATAQNSGYVNAYTNPVRVNEEVDNPKPIVNSINPKSSNIGVGTKTITITGNGFVPSSVARVNASNRPTTFIDDSHLLVQINGNDTSAYRTNGGFFITVFNGAPGGGYSNAAFFTITINNVAIPVTNTNANNGNNYNSSTTNFNETTSPDTFVDTPQTENGTSNNANENYSNLASNAIFGSNSFLPSGLIQWVLFAIVILLIVIVVRKVFGARKNYEESPMKHA